MPTKKHFDEQEAERQRLIRMHRRMGIGERKPFEGSRDGRSVPDGGLSIRQNVRDAVGISVNPLGSILDEVSNVIKRATKKRNQ